MSIELKHADKPYSLTATQRARLLELYQGEKESWPNPSLNKIDNALKHALVVVLALDTKQTTASTSSSAITPVTKEDQVLDEKSATIAAADQDKAKIVGFIILSGASNDPLLEDIIVDKAYRGQQIGARLVQTSLAIEPIKSAPTVDLYCLGGLSMYHVTTPCYDHSATTSFSSCIPHCCESRLFTAECPISFSTHCSTVLRKARL